MAKNIFHLSIENAFYFSFASFVIVWAAGFLFELLEKTPGELNIGVILLIVLSLILILFFLALTNILLSEDTSKHGFSTRIGSILLFVLLSALILGALTAVFILKF